MTDSGEYAFANCINLEELIIPDGVTTIGGWLVDECTKLRYIVFPRTFNTYLPGTCVWGIWEHRPDDLRIYTYSIPYDFAISLADGIKLNFDANGGTCDTTQKIVYPTQLYGDLPTLSREGYVFTGWYTEQEAGEKIEANTLVRCVSDETVYAKWIKDEAFQQELSLDILTYSFGNNSSSFGYPVGYKIPLESFQLIFGKTTKASSYYKSQKKWGGNCMGFSATSALLYDIDNGIIPISFDDDAQKTVDLQVKDFSKQHNMDVTTFIEAFQISQRTKLVQNQLINSRIYTLHINSGARNLNELYKAVCDLIKKGEPVVMAVYQSGAGHALLAYEVEEQSSGESRIHVYDSNYPMEQGHYITVKKDEAGNYVSWSYRISDGYGTWGTDNSTSSIGYVPYSIIEEIWETRGNLQENQNVVTFNSKNVAFRDGTDKLVATIIDGELITNSKEIYMVEDELTLEAGTLDDGVITMSMPIDAYTISNLDKSIDDFEVSVIDTNLGASIETTSDKIIWAVDDSCNLNSVQILADEGDTYCVTLNSSFAEDNAEVVVKGNGIGDMLEISQVQGEISISNCQVASLSVDGQEKGVFQITATATEGGKINPEGELAVIRGDSQTYFINPNQGYVIKDVMVDGKSVGKVTSYTFKQVKDNHSINAVFEKETGETSDTNPIINPTENPSDYAEGKKAENTVKLAKTSYVLLASPDKEQTFSLNATSDCGVLKYQVNNENISVDASGNVKVAAGFAGEAVVTITSGSEKYKDATAAVKITVEKIDNEIIVSDFTKTTAKKSQSFSMGVKQRGTGAVTYSGGSKSIKVDKSGKVTIAKNFVGSATVTINVAENGIWKSAQKNVKITVNPKGTTILALKKGKKGQLLLKWKKNTDVSGYQVQYSADKKFKKNVKSLTVKKKGTVSATIKKLTKGKKYYVRVRTYKTVSGKKYYSTWSKTKSMKVAK